MLPPFGGRQRAGASCIFRGLEQITFRGLPCRAAAVHVGTTSDGLPYRTDGPGIASSRPQPLSKAIDAPCARGPFLNVHAWVRRCWFVPRINRSYQAQPAVGLLASGLASLAQHTKQGAMPAGSDQRKRSDRQPLPACAGTAIPATRWDSHNKAAPASPAQRPEDRAGRRKALCRTGSGSHTRSVVFRLLGTLLVALYTLSPAILTFRCLTCSAGCLRACGGRGASLARQGSGRSLHRIQLHRRRPARREQHSP